MHSNADVKELIRNWKTAWNEIPEKLFALCNMGQLRRIAQNTATDEDFLPFGFSIQEQENHIAGIPQQNIIEAIRAEQRHYAQKIVRTMSTPGGHLFNPIHGRRLYSRATEVTENSADAIKHNQF